MEVAVPLHNPHEAVVLLIALPSAGGSVSVMVAEEMHPLVSATVTV